MCITHLKSLCDPSDASNNHCQSVGTDTKLTLNSSKAARFQRPALLTTHISVRRRLYKNWFWSKRRVCFKNSSSA